MKRSLIRNSEKRNAPLLEEGEIPPFVLYARKSTDEKSEKQSASIPQQIEKCREYWLKETIPLVARPSSCPIDDRTIQEIRDDNTANPIKANELISFYTQHWVVTERSSAKEPFKRKLWMGLIEMVNKQQIRGLLAYSQDRMSRNLQEGGELIQLVDNKLLALRFSTFHFEDNAAGHMMLGFWLVFAEHYSRKLREDVLRGTEKKYEEGLAIGTRKWGYTQNEQDLFIPDEFHLPILKKAFYRKLHDKWSDARIADEMNEAGWHQTLKNIDGQESKINASKISSNSLWYDPFYYGVYRREFNDREVELDLRALKYANYTFEPVLQEKEWELLQIQLDENNHREIKRRQSRRGLELNPIKPMPDGMLVYESGVAFNFMLPSRKRFDKKVIQLKTTLDKVVSPEQIRYRFQGQGEGRNIEFKWNEIDQRITKLFQSIKISEDDYQAYLYVQIEESKNKHAQRQGALKSLEMRISKQRFLQKKFYESTNMGIGLNGKQKDFWEKTDSKFEKEIKALENLKAELWDDTRDIITEQREFCNVLKRLPTIWKNANYVQKCQILEVFLLNIRVNAKKQVQINLKPELDSLFIRNGGGYYASVEPLTKWLPSIVEDVVVGIKEYFASVDLAPYQQLCQHFAEKPARLLK